MGSKPTLDAVKQAIRERVDHAIFNACLANSRGPVDAVRDDQVHQAGVVITSLAKDLAVQEGDLMNMLGQLKREGSIYSVRSRISDVKTLWWYEGLATELLADKKAESNRNTASVLINEALRSHPALTGDDPVIPHHLSEHEDARVVMVAGDNASGKSFVTKQLNKIAQCAGFEVCCSSMRQRTGDRMFSSMVYGDERRMSTGQCSVRATIKAFDHARETENPCVIILDEPDIGLSPELAMAMGQLLAEEVEAATDKLALLVVISHSRDLFHQLRAGLELKPWSSLFVGGTHPFSQWLIEPSPVCTPDDLRNLSDRSHDLYRKILACET